MAKTVDPEEGVERDLTQYATKPATASLEYYAEWIPEATGYDPAAAKSKQEAFERGVYLAVTLHRDFQTSPENQEFKERLKATRAEEAEAARAEREEAKAAKQAEREAAAAAKEQAKAERAASEKPAKAAKATATRPAAKKATPAAPPTKAARPARRTAKGAEAPF